MKNKLKKIAATQLSRLFIRDDISISLQIIWHFPDWSCGSYFNYKPTKKKVLRNNRIQNTKNTIWRNKNLKNKSKDRDYNIKSGRYSYVVIKTKLYCHCRCIFALKVRQFTLLQRHILNRLYRLISIHTGTNPYQIELVETLVWTLCTEIHIIENYMVKSFLVCIPHPVPTILQWLLGTTTSAR